jgi:hypothetical protein
LSITTIIKNNKHFGATMLTKYLKHNLFLDGLAKFVTHDPNLSALSKLNPTSGLR